MKDTERTAIYTVAAVRRPAIMFVLGTALLAGGAGAAHALREAPPQVTVAAPSMPASFADLVAHTSPSVVSIRTLGASAGNGAQSWSPDALPAPLQRFFEQYGGHQGRPDKAPKSRGAGSGFIVDESGLVVTNHHVIDGAEKITVTLNDGTTLPAKVRGVDRRTDLAVLEVQADQPLVAARFGDSDTARTGDWVVAVGNPFGLGGTYTAGIISARGRDIGSGPEDDFLQVDAPINRGNSGGALFNVSGEVVGVNTAIYSPNGGSVGIGFAVPANLARHVVENLIEHGRVARGWLGVRIQALTPELANGLGMEKPEGAVVVAVDADSPAARAGLRPGDVVQSVDDESVSTPRDLARLIAARADGADVTLTLWRARRAETVRVELTELKVAAADTDTSEEPAPGGLGLTLAPLSEDAARRFGSAGTGEGALIVEVAPDSAAARASLTPGMIIRRVGTVETVTPAAVAAAIRAARERSDGHLVLLVESPQGGAAFVALPLA